MELIHRIDRIRNAMRENGISIQQLSDMCNISSSTISRTLSGKTEPTEHTIRTMETALGITDAPTGEPIMDMAASDPILERYLNMQEMRIVRMRAHYNMLLAEKNRWIMMLFVLSLILVSFICIILIFDVMHPNIGWIRQQLGLGSDWFHDTIDLIKECLRTFV